MDTNKSAVVALGAFAAGGLVAWALTNKQQASQASGKIPAIKLTYFNIQGVAEKVRLVFHLAHVPFEDVRISFQEWGSIKSTTPFGQLPIMTIDGQTIAQSNTMLNFAASLAPQLYPVEPQLRLLIDEAVCLVDDFNRDFRPCIYISMRPEVFGYPEEVKNCPVHAERIKTLRTKFVENDLPKYMGFFAAKLAASGNAFICGPKPTIADCCLVPALRNFQRGHLDYVPTTCLDQFPTITAYIERFLGLPEVAAYYASQK